MKLKNFAGFLIAGKLMLNSNLFNANLAFGSDVPTSLKNEKLNQFASSLNVNLNDILTNQVNLIEMPIPDSLELYSVSSSGDNYGNIDTAAQINVPGTNCNFNKINDFTLLLTGVQPGDEIYIGISTEYNENGWPVTNGKLKLGNDIKVVGYFKITGRTQFNSTIPGLGQQIQGNLNNVYFPISLKINISDIESLVGQSFYIQAVIFPNGNLSWDSAKFSEVDKIYVNQKNCEGSYGGSSY